MRLVPRQFGVQRVARHQFHGAAQRPDGVELDARRRLRRINRDANAHPLPRQGDSLAVVAGRGGDHAAPALLVIQQPQLVAGAAKFKGTGVLQVVAFQIQLAAQLL